MSRLAAWYHTTAHVVGELWLGVLLAAALFVALVAFDRMVMRWHGRRRWHRSPCCLTCGQPGKFDQLHGTIPGRHCPQCAVGVVEARRIFEALAHRRAK